MKARKTKSGKYQCFGAWYDNAGNRHLKSFTASTKKEAEIKARQFEMDSEKSMFQKHCPNVGALTLKRFTSIPCPISH